MNKYSIPHILSLAIIVSLVIITAMALICLLLVLVRANRFLKRNYYLDKKLSIISPNPIETMVTLKIVENFSRNNGDMLTAIFAKFAIWSQILWYILVIVIFLFSIFHVLV